MAILASELRYYGSNTMQDTDSGTQGGAINTAIKIEFTQMTGNSTLEAVSSASGDTTQTVTVTGRNAAGELITTSAVTLNGTTAVSMGATTFERILKVVLSATCTGTISVRNSSGGTVWGTLESGFTQVRVPFYNAAAEPSGGSNKDYYEKVFVRNTNSTLTLTNAVVAEQADPSGKITFALATTLNDSGTSTNRLTVPASGVSAFDNTTKNVANSQNLTSGAQQGVWLKLSLTAGDAANKTSYTLRTQGSSV